MSGFKIKLGETSSQYHPGVLVENQHAGVTTMPMPVEEEMHDGVPRFNFEKKLDLSGCFEKFVKKDAGDPNSNTFTWSQDLLEDCALAIQESDGSKVQYLMWVLNELSSPYGDCEQRLASAFLQAMFARLSTNGSQHYHALCAAAAKSHSYNSMKKTMLKFQELSPWMTAGMAAANGAILEALAGEKQVHILDISNNFCTQWPTLFEALAMRADHPPKLRLTTFSVSSEATSPQVMKEITQRLEKFARLMGIPFDLAVLQQPDIEKLDARSLDLRQGEALIINSNHSLHHTSERQHEQLMALFQGLKPKSIIVVEDEVDLASSNLMDCFREAFKFYSMFFESLDTSFPRISNERLMIERTAARKIVAALSSEDHTNIKRQETCAQWGFRMEQAGFAAKPLKDEVVDDVQALLKRYKPGWSLCRGELGVFLSWKNQNAISVSAWKHTDG